MIRHLAPLLLLVGLAAPLAAQAQPVNSTTVVESDGTITLHHETVIAADPDAIWQAVSTAEGWMTWAVPLAWQDRAAGTLETSYDRNARPGDASTIVQQIVLTIPGRLLAFRTTKAPQGFPAAETYYRVTSVIDLEPVTTGTRVRLTSVNFADTEEGWQLSRFFVTGNAQTLEQLAERFVSGPRDWSAATP